VTVYEGELKRMSGGTQQLSVDRADHAFIRHEFIEIGDARLKSVRMLTFHNALLEDAIGKNVALSMAKGRGQYMVAALRLPDGTVERVDRGTVLTPAIVFGLQRIGAAAFFVVIALIASALKVPLLALALAALALWLVVDWALTWRKVFAARAAL
jgi:hypothetical protein